MATRGLPAWARPIIDAGAAVRGPDSRPFPHLPAGHASMPQIKHIVVLMMENHSFDNLLGMVPYEVPGGPAVDGLGRRARQVHRLQPKHQRPPRVRQPRADALSATGSPRPELERQPPVVGQRPQRRLRAREWADRDEHLGRARPAVQLLAGQALPDRPAVLLLGARADLPQPPLHVHRHRLGDDRHRQHHVLDPGGQRHDLGPARRPPHRLGDLLPERPELADRAGLVHRRAGASPAQVRDVRRRRRRRQAPPVHVSGPRLQHHLRGEPPGHPGGRAVRRPGGHAR